MVVINIECVVPENIHTSTTEGIENSEGEFGWGWGVQRPRKFQRGGEGGGMIKLVSRGTPEFFDSIRI